MKAAVYKKSNTGKVLEIVELDTPVPKDHEVLIKIRVASINPLDWRLKSRRPGVDLAGQVEAVGKNVIRFKLGDAVFGVGKGAFAEYACATESTLVSKPDDITFEQAASLPIAGLTALQGLRDKGHLQPGQKVLINGAAGGVGTFAVQIAKSLGAHVTGVCSTKNIEMVGSLGADRVIDYTRDDFTTEKQCYDLLLDNVGNRPFSAFRRVMAAHGKCVLVGAPKRLSAVITRILKALTWKTFLRRKFTFFIAKIDKDDLMTLCHLMKSGKLNPIIDRSYVLTEAAAAIAYVEEGHARAKVLVQSE